MLESNEIDDRDPMQRNIFLVSVGLIFNISATSALALNLGRGVLGSTLGQPLGFSVQVSSEAEEGITAECVSAEVYSGENKLAPGAVKISTDGAAAGTQFRIRVSTLVAIDEPVVTVAVGLGCPARVTRRFVLFVDPPLVVAPVDAVSEPGLKTPLLSNQAPSSAPAARSAGNVDRNSQPAASVESGRVGAADTVIPKRQRRLTAPEAAFVSAPTESSVASPVAAPEVKVASKPAAQRPPAVARAAPAAAVVPRLKLDAAPLAATVPTPTASFAASLADTLAANASVNAAAMAAASASAANAALQMSELRASTRVAVLEERLAKLQAEAQASRQTLDALQVTVRQAQAAKSASAVLPWVLGASAAFLAAVVAGLLWPQSRRRRKPSWWTGGRAQPLPAMEATSVSAETRHARSTATATPAATPGPTGTATGAGSATGDETSSFASSQRDASTVAPGQAPQALAPGTALPLTAHEGAPNAGFFPSAHSPAHDHLNGAEASRATPFAALIDLQQQADFFIVLGQDDAAIDLLTTHLRSAGGISPLPYMKLLDIYRRLGNVAAYERVRERLERQFNVDVPAADVDPDEGRSITDYPDVLAYLIGVWPDSLNAAEILGQWLERGSGEVPTGTTGFDLPAYGELLCLYWMALDLSARESFSGGIDFLLPLATLQSSAFLNSHGASMASVSPSSVESGDDLDGGLDLDLDLDLDLSLPLVAVSSSAGANRETGHDEAGANSDFMSLNIDSRLPT